MRGMPSLGRKSKVVRRTLRNLVCRSAPYFAHLYLTRRCNLRCRMCNVWKTPCKELDTKSIFQIIDRLDMLGVAHIQLTGGEPFLRKDVAEIIGYAKSKGLSVHISTNGILPRSVYEKMRKVPISDIGVSLHSANSGVHEKINGVPGSWKKTIKTIRFLKEMGKKVYVCCVVSSLNLRETPDIVRFCENELGVPIGLQPAVTGGSDALVFRGKDLALNVADPELIDSVVKQTPIFSMRRTRTFMNTAFKVLSGEKVRWNCRAGRMFFAVMADGRFGICQDILTDLNVLDENFFDRVDSEEFRNKAEKLAKNCQKCVYACYYDITNMFAHPLEALDVGLRVSLFGLVSEYKRRARQKGRV